MLDAGGKLMRQFVVFHEWPLMKDTDKMDNRLESFRDAVVGG
jgi:hypothetical protein